MSQEHNSSAPAPAAATADGGCGCASTGLKKPPAWQGFVAASVLPSAEAAPEPEAAQGEYNPLAPETPLSVPLLAGAGIAPSHPVELLSPAGGLDAGYAAFHYGADAIYLGLKKFSARAEAENFTLEDVDAITSFAHSLTPRRRVFVTLNTLILQNELGELIEALGALSDIGVDALIVQDLGVYHIVRKYFPELELHASTQLAVHNRAGAESLRQMGFTRVVLARELTLEEVADITATSGIETEVFIHGALCYSYSGLCLFSSQINGRSGNRGKCAYSCRDEFQISGAPETLRDGTDVKRNPNTGFAFSMKDLALPDHLPALRAAGVSCVKIEGRKKSPLYVATTTDYYRRLLDGELSETERREHEADMKTVFSRPWTRLFTQSHKDKEVADRDTVGHRGNPIGAVEAVLDAGSEQPLLRFTTSRAIERHDGLQIDVPGLGKPFGFAVESLRLVVSGGKFGKGQHQNRKFVEVFEALAGATVDVALPEEHPVLPLGSPIYCSSSQDVKRRYRHARPKPGLFRARRTVDIEIALTPAEICVSARVLPRNPREELVAIRHSAPGPFQVAKDVQKMEAAIRGAFEKLGETRLSMGSLAIENPGKLFVPVSQLNALRREVSDELERRLDAAQARRVRHVEAEVLPKELPRTGKTKEDPRLGFNWSIKIDRAAYLDEFESSDWERIDEVVVDITRDPAPLISERLNKLAGLIGKEHIRLSLPALTRKWEEKDILRKIRSFQESGWNKWEAANVSAWTFLGAPISGGMQAGAQIELSTDWSVYTINRAAALQALEMGAARFVLSPEDSLGNMRSLLREFGPRAVLIVHQDTPLFLAESCAYANLIGGCPGKANCKFESMEMISSYGEKVTAIDYHCRTIVLNKGAFCLAPRLRELGEAGAQSLRADFINRKYEPAAVRDAWRHLREGRNVPGGHAANFDRGLL